MQRTRVAIGLSGGVDSAVSAAFLVDQGYDVTGIYLECWRSPGCRTEEDRKDALDVALKLNIPYEVLDFKVGYKQQVVDYFYREYASGRTPNPDVVCNREIKFGLFYRWAMEQGYEAVATGHYARVKRVNGSWRLLQGADRRKDQSYFLYPLREDQLAHVLFPIGHLTKREVREEAKKRGLLVAEKPDSQGICFVGEVSVERFLKDLGMQEEPGEVIYRGRRGEAVVIGAHKGVGFYTIGQRHGFTLDKNMINKARLGFETEQMPSVYVLEKDIRTNRLRVGLHEEAMTDRFQLERLHWIGTEQGAGTSMGFRIRHGGEVIDGVMEPLEDETTRVRLGKRVFGIAPGQAAVFYRNEAVIGGGIITG